MRHSIQRSEVVNDQSHLGELNHENKKNEANPKVPAQTHCHSDNFYGTPPGAFATDNE